MHGPMWSSGRAQQRALDAVVRHVSLTWHIWCDVSGRAWVEAKLLSKVFLFGASLNIQKLPQLRKIVRFKDETDRTFHSSPLSDLCQSLTCEHPSNADQDPIRYAHVAFLFLPF